VQKETTCLRSCYTYAWYLVMIDVLVFVGGVGYALYAAVYAKQGIRCNAVCRPVDTGLVGAFLTDEHQWQRRAVHLPDGRLGTPEEIANAVLYLASDESSWTNGCWWTAASPPPTPRPSGYRPSAARTLTKSSNGS
jgi:hypothetical protein